MPRKTGKKRKKNKIQTISGRDLPVVISGKFLWQTTTNALQTLNLNPYFDSRLAYFAGGFQEFRFTNLQLRLHSTTATYVVGYFKTFPVNVPSNIQSCYETQCSRVSSTTDTVPVTLTVDRSTLMSGVRSWYICNSGAGDTANDLNNGVIYIYPSAAATRIIEMSYTCVFRGATTPSVM